MICVLLLVIFLFVKWTNATIPPPALEEGIEVNLGNSDQGLGEDQPFLPGPPAPADQHAYTPPKPSRAENNAVKDVETDDKDKEAPSIVKPAVTKPTTKLPDREIVNNKTIVSREPVVTTPPVQKPKAVFKGVNGTGTGGNEADTYKKGGNQGIAGGTGDQGRPGGNPSSTNYSGPGGRGSGVFISKGLEGRKFTSLPSFQDDFNENAKIAVDIRVDETGRVTMAIYQPRGSTTSDAAMKAIAIRKAQQIKFNTSGEESMGTIVFNFKLKN